jgi:hypothetical protein
VPSELQPSPDPRRLNTDSNQRAAVPQSTVESSGSAAATGLPILDGPAPGSAPVGYVRLERSSVPTWVQAHRPQTNNTSPTSSPSATPTRFTQHSRAAARFKSSSSNIARPLSATTTTNNYVLTSTRFGHLVHRPGRREQPTRPRSTSTRAATCGLPTTRIDGRSPLLIGRALHDLERPFHPGQHQQQRSRDFRPSLPLASKSRDVVQPLPPKNGGSAITTMPTTAT